MNDELSGQLAAAGYTLPGYAQGKLALHTEHDEVMVEGEQGLFTLTVPAPELRVVLGSGESALPLATLRWQPDNLDWRGQAGIGGSVEALTVLEVGGLPVTVLTVLGAPLLPDVTPYPVPGTPAGAIPPAFADGVSDGEEHYYTFLAPEDSALVPLAENALMNRLNMWLHGRLAADEAGWHTLVALPLLLERGTLFAAL